MSFVSTRDTSGAVGSGRVDLATALLAGLAPDGGLYLPEHVPPIDFAGLPPDDFPELATRILTPWLEEFMTLREVEALAADAFSFPVPLVRISDSVSILELFHGPTLSFKDFGGRTLGRLLGHLLQEKGEEVTIVVATSGDTGSAVADGCSGIPGVRVVLLYPAGQVSPTQEQQLIVEREGVTALRVHGSFDDCQRLVKGAFADSRLRHKRLSTANSINMGRLLPQMLYYVHAAKQYEAPVTFCVPSGNLGNLTAGMLAAESGMPVAGFLAAHNRNDFFPAWLSNAERAFNASVQTPSNAMDVGAPSNFERLTAMYAREELVSRVSGVSVTDKDTVSSIRCTLQETGYVADPHTAVGLEAVRRLQPEGQVVVLSTAHPAKFPETVEPAIGRKVTVPPQLTQLQQMPSSVQDMEADAGALADAILG